jgi:hypothetical protein
MGSGDHPGGAVLLGAVREGEHGDDGDLGPIGQELVEPRPARLVTVEVLGVLTGSDGDGLRVVDLGRPAVGDEPTISGAEDGVVEADVDERAGLRGQPVQANGAPTVEELPLRVAAAAPGTGGVDEGAQIVEQAVDERYVEVVADDDRAGLVDGAIDVVDRGTGGEFRDGCRGRDGHGPIVRGPCLRSLGAG